MMRTSNDILLSRIIFGSMLVKINSKKYIYRKASKEINYKADLLYEETIQDHIYDGWLTLDKAKFVLIENGLWSNNHENTLKELDKQLEDYKILLFENFMFTKKKQDYRNKIKNIRKQTNNFSTIRHSIDQHTIEAYASRIRNEYIIMNCLYNSTNTHKVFNKNKKNESDFLNDCANEISKNIPSIDSLKSLVKSEIWKSYWSASGKGNVFGADISDYSDEQRVIINLSRMYDSVYEHPECPSDDIIEDDDALDGWMIFQKRKREKEKKGQVLSTKSSKANNASEVFVMATDKQEAEEIFELNTPDSRNALQEKQKVVLSTDKPIDDLLLPDVQRDLQMKINQGSIKKG
jgi:hypothetical protein